MTVLVVGMTVTATVAVTDVHSVAAEARRRAVVQQGAVDHVEDDADCRAELFNFNIIFSLNYSIF
jgi:hypothetical protein